MRDATPRFRLESVWNPTGIRLESERNPLGNAVRVDRLQTTDQKPVCAPSMNRFTTAHPPADKPRPTTTQPTHFMDASQTQPRRATVTPDSNPTVGAQ